MQHARYLLVAMGFAAVTARASSPKIWIGDSARDLSAGVSKGLLVKPAGGLALGYSPVKIEGIEASRILSAAEEPGGGVYFRNR